MCLVFVLWGHRKKVTTPFGELAKTSPKTFELVLQRPVERLSGGKIEDGKHHKAWEKSMEEKGRHTKEIVASIWARLIGHEAGKLDWATCKCFEWQAQWSLGFMRYKIRNDVLYLSYRKSLWQQYKWQTGNGETCERPVWRLLQLWGCCRFPWIQLDMGII